MEKELNELKKEITGAIAQDIILDDITVEKEGKYLFLRIVLDKVGGIDLDTIVEATHIINPIVDKYSFIDDSFILDVISKEKGDVHNG